MFGINYFRFSKKVIICQNKYLTENNDFKSLLLLKFFCHLFLSSIIIKQTFIIIRDQDKFQIKKFKNPHKTIIIVHEFFFYLESPNPQSFWRLLPES